MVLSTVALFLWARIVYYSYKSIFSLEFILKVKNGQEEKQLFDLISSLSYYFTLYRKVQGLNAIFLVCGIFAYFSFSLKLSVVLHVVRLAKKELFSYAIIFVTVVFGFGIGGYMIYGDKLENFNSVLRSSLEIILMTIGGVNYELMKSAEPYVTPVFVFTYLIAAYVIFLKMVIVILDATYKDLISFVKKEDVSLLDYLNALVEEITAKINEYMKEKSDEDIRKKFKDQTSLYSKLRLWIELFYYKIIKALEARLWMITKALLQFKNKKTSFDKIEHK